MAFQDDLATHIERIRSRMPHVQGEEATKQALVVPLLQVLGYDVFDPREVRPEYVADFAVKKAGQFEKIDYTICVGGLPVIFVECKALGAALEDHSGQLSRYFNSTPSVRVAWITDGVRFRVFTDLHQPNIMDVQPWLSIDLLSIKPAEIDALRRFRKADFSPSDISALAEEMVYYSAILAFVSSQLREPTDAFVRFVAGEIPAVGRVTAKVVERLTPILRKALQSAIVDQVARSLDRSAEPIAEPEPPPAPAKPQPAKGAADATTTSSTSEPKTGIVTTPEELEANRLIVTWIRETNANAPVGYRDSKSYLTIHQDNVRKWFVRLGLEDKPMWVAFRHIKPDEARRLAPGVEVAESARFGDSRVILSSVADLSKLRTAIISAYDRETARKDEGPAEPSET
jgi:hypothetical protein